MTARKPNFDRIRPRTPAAQERADLTVPAGAAPLLGEGRRALFSQTSARPAFGSVTLECSSCGTESALTATRVLRAMVPSLHLPLLRRRYPSYMRCPACSRRTWVALRFRV